MSMLARSEEEVEALLRREVRARLPLARQLLLYLDPFSLFKDASRGRERALSYNRALRWILLSYLRRWSCIATSSPQARRPRRRGWAKTASGRWC